MEDQRIDLSPLDPARDGRAWESTIQRLADRGVAIRNEQQGILPWLFAWGRPVFALAAVCALVVWWVGREAAPTNMTMGTNTVPPALLIAGWAAQDSIPTSSELFAVVGELHDNR